MQKNVECKKYGSLQYYIKHLDSHATGSVHPIFEKCFHANYYLRNSKEMFFCKTSLFQKQNGR